MTTKLMIQNDGTSNGDVVVRFSNVCYIEDPRLVAGVSMPTGAKELRLLPGDPAVSLGITDYSLVAIHEEWPSVKNAPEPSNAPEPPPPAN